MTIEWLQNLNYATLISQCVFFYIELIFGILLFSFFFKRRNFFALRLAGCIVFIGTASALIVGLAYYLYNEFGIYEFRLLMLLGTIAFSYLFVTLFTCIGMVRFCFSVRAWEAVFSGVAAYSVQHIIFRLNLLFRYYVYFDVSPMLPNVLFLLFSAAAVYGAAYFFFARRLKGREHVEVENRKLVAMLGIVLIVMMIFGGLSFTYMGNESMRNSAMMFVECGFAIIVCCFTLFSLHDSIRSKDMEAEKERIQWLWRVDRKQFEVSKHNVEQLNVKYHDLKYMLRGMRAGGSEEEIERYLRLYEAHFCTGNETLDVVLTEKSLLGMRYGIDIVCVADGRYLAGMDPVHLYSLFGNALDNAIECLKTVEEKEKKVVNVTVRGRGGMVMAQIENYTPHAPVFRGGLPVTTKEDAENHGFGMISMRNIVACYGGSMRAEVADNIFSLTILFPASFGKGGENGSESGRNGAKKT